MDRAIYVAMNGAMASMRAQTANTNNIANVNTVGFRRDMNAFREAEVNGYGLRTRVAVTRAGEGSDMSPGPLKHTGRNLDVAIRGKGWVAVQTPDGGEAYTRAGNFRLTSAGQLMTTDGHPVIGNAGPIAVPPYSNLNIGEDGTISIVPLGAQPDEVAVVDRIKLVDPPDNQLYKDTDTLMHTVGGQPLAADANVHVVSGFLEQSNVTPATALVRMIQLARQYEMQVKEIRASDQNAQSSQQLLRMS